MKGSHMPAFRPSSQESFSDKSELTRGRKPAFLCAITEELVPDGWPMQKRPGDTMFRWHFAIWENEQAINARQPEHQTAVSSKIFSPAGKKNPASKCWLWTAELLGRLPNPGEAVDLDPMMPLPCRLKVERTKRDGTPVDFAVIADLEGWPEGAQLLTPELKAKLQALAAVWAQSNSAPEFTAEPQARFAQPSQPPVGWGQAAREQQEPAAAVKPTW